MAADLVTEINWTGSLNTYHTVSSTPFGLYDLDSKFISDAPRVSECVAKRLGYPVQNVELLPENIFACFEEATSEYSAQVNAFNIRNNLYNMLGHTNNDNLTDTYVEGANTTQLINISQAYGAEANVGGFASIHKGRIQLIPGIQRYDLKNIDPTQWGVNPDTTDLYNLLNSLKGNESDEELNNLGGFEEDDSYWNGKWDSGRYTQ